MTVTLQHISPEIAEIIRCKKSQYGRFMDTHQLDKLRELILPDAKMIFRNPDGTVMKLGDLEMSFSSREEFIALHAKQAAGSQSIHIIGPGELEQTGPDTVKAIFPLIYPVSTNRSGNFVSGAHYYETWIRREGDWFLESIDGTYVYQEMK